MTDHKASPRGWADITYNDKGIFFATRSGNVMAALDDNGIRRFMPREASNKMLGEALLECIAVSRVVPQEEWKAFFDWRDVDKRWKDYEKWKMQQTNVKTLRALRKAMMSCSCHLIEDELVMYPCDHSKVNDWSYPKDYIERAVCIPFTSSVSNIGTALREAMNRCTGLGREEAQLPEPMPD
jgi:hypothetical protein